MTDTKKIINGIQSGNFRSIARAITLIENELQDVQTLLKSLDFSRQASIIGITGAPGTGKSTLVNAMIGCAVARGKKVAVIAVDPTSPFTKGSLLGDRIRMGRHFNNSLVFIRSLATRGSLGGLSAKASEIVDLLTVSGFDLVIIETVGVGQSEIDVVKLAQQTVLVLAPDGGDEIQHIKSGIMEIADCFVVNKSDREGSTSFMNVLQHTLAAQHIEIPIFRTVADQAEGTDDLFDWLLKNRQTRKNELDLLTDKAILIIGNELLKSIDREKIKRELSILRDQANFNIYTYCSVYTNSVRKSGL